MVEMRQCEEVRSEHYSRSAAIKGCMRRLILVNLMYTKFTEQIAPYGNESCFKTTICTPARGQNQQSIVQTDRQLSHTKMCLGFLSDNQLKEIDALSQWRALNE